MRYGGLGGLGGFPPQRYGTPNSGWVQSNDEFTSEWQSRAPNQYIGGESVPERNIADETGYGMPQSPPNRNIAGTPDPRMPAGRMNPGYTGPYIDDTPERFVTTPQTINPAWEEWNTNFQRAQGLRQENQTRQQQAYDSMRNNGALNGVMPQFYNQPGYGQVSGNNSQLNANGGTQVEGVDNSWTSGAYVPRPGMNGAYNPTPYAAGQLNNPEWKL